MRFNTVLVFTLSLLVSLHTNATLISALGGVDTFIASTTLANSGENTELSWVRDILQDQSITLDEKYKSSASDWSLVSNETDVYFTDLLSSPGYFILKFGIGGTDIDSHLLFENIGNLTFGVIDFSLAGIDLSKVNNFTMDRISHVNEFSGLTPQKTNIPEPMTITIFALAIFGLTRHHRRSK